ncbi:cerberus [Thomomys bottae]
MHLLLLQLLVLLPLGKGNLSQDGRPSQNSFPLVLLERSRRELPLHNQEEGEDRPDLFVAMPHLMGTSLPGEEQRQREKTFSKFGKLWKKPEKALHRTRELERERSPPRIQDLPQPMEGMKADKSPLREEAKKFWRHFMLRKGPASQGVILPIKSHEVHRETCRTVPFSQTVSHEDCEKVVVQNNLCFGKCGTAQFPGPAPYPPTFCSHCSPSKFTMMHLQLNCTGLTPVVKVVMQVEECQCTVKTEHGHGHFLWAGSQDSFIPGVST